MAPPPPPPNQNILRTHRTHQPEPSGAPQDVRCHSSSSTNILVSWLPPATELQNGIITQYTVQYAATEGEDTAPRQISGIPPGSSQYLLENLDKFTEYRVSVTAHTDVGAGPESPPQLVRTEEDGMCLLKRRRKLTPRTLLSTAPCLLLIRRHLLWHLLDWAPFLDLTLCLLLHKLLFSPLNAAQFQHMVRPFKPAFSPFSFFFF